MHSRLFGMQPGIAWTLHEKTTDIKTVMQV